MEIVKSIAIMKALSDTSRVRIVKALSEKPCYVEELASRLNLADSTVSFHLKKLQLVGLVSSHKQQYYIIYTLNKSIFGLTLEEIVNSEDDESKKQAQRLISYKDKTIRAFFKNGKLIALPVQHKKRLIVLSVFKKLFTPGKTYTEKEVTEIVTPLFSDYCTIRRLMIEEGWMERSDGIYSIQEEDKNESNQ